MKRLNIEDIWSTEQEILDEIDRICKKYNLRYSLAFGTLIGAIRHKGFIPWDDDLDIMMPREDYNKLMQIWDSESSENYILQNYDKDLDYTNNFAKIRKNHTTFLQRKEEKKRKYHKGIFVDIFPADCVASGKISRKIQYVACAVNLLYTKGFMSGSKGIMGIIENALLHVPSKYYPKLRNKSERLMSYWNSKGGQYLFFPCTIGCCKTYYPSDMFNKLLRIEFNGKFYFAVKDYDMILRIEYGDYMKLPPEDERQWKHHPVLIDLEHNFEEIGEEV